MIVSAEKELAALRAQEPVAYKVSDVLLENMVQALAFKANTDLEIKPLYIQPVPAAPVAAPNAIRVQKALLWLDGIMMKHPGMKEPITCAEVLRLNSGSKHDG